MLSGNKIIREFSSRDKFEFVGVDGSDVDVQQVEHSILFDTYVLDITINTGDPSETTVIRVQTTTDMLIEHDIDNDVANACWFNDTYLTFSDPETSA